MYQDQYKYQTGTFTGAAIDQFIQKAKHASQTKKLFFLRILGHKRSI